QGQLCLSVLYFPFSEVPPLGGAVLTDGSTLGTLGGAAVGGVIGHQVGK
ncbi:hypothetical protein FSI21_018895, partial [Escherichia coli]|nr:hypothetical protein [Escherichia coli]